MKRPQPMASLIESEESLVEVMTRPTPEVESAVSAIDGDIVILGVAGKMGPTLAELLIRAGARHVIGVSRFSEPAVELHLQAIGVDTIRADLLDDSALTTLPDAACVYLMAGFKFGATGNQTLTWAANALLPPRVVERYRDTKIVYVSSGNVYAYTPVDGGGADEDGILDPVGEYAQSRLGGERLATYMAERLNVELLIVRLFYATELRYGILHDLAHNIVTHTPIDLTMGHVNQIWQGDANAYLARVVAKATDPATVLNMTGPEVISVREIAHALGNRLGVDPVFEGTESETALLGDSSKLFKLLGTPPTPLMQMADWVAHWVDTGGCSLGKPTKYQSRDGVF